jgi:predicted GTPase
VGHSYRRYLENRMREEHALQGVPVRLIVRRRERRGDASERERR